MDHFQQIVDVECVNGGRRLPNLVVRVERLFVWDPQNLGGKIEDFIAAVPTPTAVRKRSCERHPVIDSDLADD